MRMLGLFAGAALVLAACGGGQATEPLTISEVTVQADLPAVGSPQAMSYWQNLSGDLETAIAAQFVGRIDPAGKRDRRRRRRDLAGARLRGGGDGGDGAAVGAGDADQPGRDRRGRL